MEAIVNIYCRQNAVDHSTVSEWLKKLCPCCKNLDEQARSVRPKSMDSEAVWQTIEANPGSSTQRVSGFSQPGVFHSFHDLDKTNHSC